MRSAGLGRGLCQRGRLGEVRICVEEERKGEGEEWEGRKVPVIMIEFPVTGKCPFGSAIFFSLESRLAKSYKLPPKKLQYFEIGSIQANINKRYQHIKEKSLLVH
jgi:hypothetical protein